MLWWILSALLVLVAITGYAVLVAASRDDDYFDRDLDRELDRYREE